MADLSRVIVRPVQQSEQKRFQLLLQQHHYLGAIPKISETLWYVATINEQWVALLSFSAAALKCSARDRWIGWDFRYQYDRLKLLTNNSRFLILPDWHVPNLATRILSLCQKRLSSDWQTTFGHPLVLLETFVDPQRFRGTIYKAANWTCVGTTKGFSRTRNGYSTTSSSPKLVFLRPLINNARQLLSQPVLNPAYRTEGGRIMLSVEHMKSLPDFFKDIPDPRRGQGRRHRLCAVLAIAAGATLCGMHGYLGISDWAKNLGQKALRLFGCRYQDNRYIPPSLSIIRDVLIRVDPVQLDRAIGLWNQSFALHDQSLAIDGKTMCNAIDEQGFQTHIMSAVGHQSKICYTQKK